jgi:hypothetical protein
MKKSFRILLISLAIAGVLLFFVTRATTAISEAVLDIELFLHVQDFLNQTPEGQHYVKLLYDSTIDMIEIMQKEPELVKEFINGLKLWEPNLQALVDGEGHRAVITREQVEAMKSVIAHIRSLASPTLQQIIDAEHTRRPLDQGVGMNMNDAWAYIYGYEFKWLTPASDASHYIVVQGSAIPISFSIEDFHGNFVEDGLLALQVFDSKGNQVLGSVGLSTSTAQRITIQAGSYHYDLETHDLAEGMYIILVLYNAHDPSIPASLVVTIISAMN